MRAPILNTPRLRLRGWQQNDLAPFAAMNRDPQVMEFFPKLLERSESDERANRFGERHFEQRGVGWWAVELVDGSCFIGCVGLLARPVEFPFSPCVEIGWRLARAHWGKGYATEAARTALAFGFGARGLEEIVSFTVPANVRSRAVMEKLGMVRNPDDNFEHPGLPECHSLRPHVLYRLNREAWLSAMG
ncbi:MAG TPA: GNAT family N-acetyltransferase [Micropepsaceae bacterium]|nr:GNAT family N-acetyltransferase [Micropepsaceae bacterium]